MQRLFLLRFLILRAAATIRRRGLIGFVRRLLNVGSWLPIFLAGTKAVPAYFPGNKLGGTVEGSLGGDEIVGAIDEPHDGFISRRTGQIYGWALSLSATIDRVEIFVDEQWVGNARICLPRLDIRSDLPEARICGFQMNLRPEQMPADRDAIQVGFAAHSTCGEARRSPSRAMLLGRRRDSDFPAIATPFTKSTSPRTRMRIAKKIKVACFTHDLGYGGGQLYLQELLRQLAGRAKVDCVIRSPKDGPLRNELSLLGFLTEICQEPSTTNVDDHDCATDAISNWLLNNDFDCVLANTLGGYYAINAAAKVGLPNIWAIHESFPLATWSALYTQERPGSEFFLSRIKAALGRCSAVIFESDATRQMFIEHGSEDRFLKIAYGIDNSAIENFLRDFDRDSARDRLGISKSAKVLLCMGTLEPRKQQILLTQAFAKVLPSHREAYLWLVGDHPSLYSIALHQYLERKGLDRRIRLFPVVPDPYPWYAVADGFALLSDLESMPRSLIEAMGFGLPALATRVFGIADLIDDGETGLLVEPNSLRSATEGLNNLLCLSDTERNSIARAAKEKIRLNYDSHAYADAYLALIGKLVGEAQMPHRHSAALHG